MNLQFILQSRLETLTYAPKGLLSALTGLLAWIAMAHGAKCDDSPQYPVPDTIINGNALIAVFNPLTLMHRLHTAI